MEHPTSDVDPFVQFILSAGMTPALLREHRDDGHSPLRRVFDRGQAGRYVWPRDAAVAATAQPSLGRNTLCMIGDGVTSERDSIMHETAFLACRVDSIGDPARRRQFMASGIMLAEGEVGQHEIGA